MQKEQLYCATLPIKLPLTITVTFKFDGYDGEIKTKVYVDATWTIPTTFPVPEWY